MSNALSLSLSIVSIAKSEKCSIWASSIMDQDTLSGYSERETADSRCEVLGFEGNYDSLEQGRTRDSIELGQRPLQDAINQLARLRGQIKTKKDKEDTMQSLLVVIQMISESVRFLYISELLILKWVTSYTPDTRMINYENGWGALSGALLHDDQDAHWRRSWRLRHPNIMGIESAIAAVAIIAILLCRQLPGPSRPKRQFEPAFWNDQLPGPSRPEREVEATLLDGQLPGPSPTKRKIEPPFKNSYPRGRVLVEVFWLRINNIDGEDPGNLYGTITAVDGQGSQYVFNRDRSDPYSIKPGNYALITGPPECISAADSMTLNVDLWDYDIVSSDDKIAQGKTLWHPYDQNRYNSPVAWEISGDYGSATLYYVVLSNAAQAVVEVVLINGDGEDPADVYGSIKGNNGYGDSELFRKKVEENIPVHPDADIPLLRNAIAVPVKSSLNITALLYDHDTISADDEIANGTASFTPRILQSEKKYIIGEYGKIEVRVTWS